MIAMIVWIVVVVYYLVLQDYQSLQTQQQQPGKDEAIEEVVEASTTTTTTTTVDDYSHSVEDFCTDEVAKEDWKEFGETAGFKRGKNEKSEHLLSYCFC